MYNIVDFTCVNGYFTPEMHLIPNKELYLNTANESAMVTPQANPC